MKHSLRLQIPVFIAIRTLVNTMVRMVYPFLPVFSRGLGVDVQKLSLGLSLRSASGIFGPFLASLADTRGRKTGMLFGLVLFCLGAGMVAAWPTYPAFVAALVLSFIGNAVFIPSMQAYLGDRVPYQRRGLALALTEFGWSLSFIIGVPLVGLAIARSGWQAPFPFLAGFGIVAIIVLFWLLPKDQPADGKKSGAWRNLHSVFTFPPALAGLALGLAMSGSNEMVNVIFSVWMEDAFQVKIATLATASVIIGVSELGAEGLVSLFTDRLGKARAVGIGLALNSLALLALPVLGSSLGGALAGLFLLYITFEFTMVSSIPLMSEVLPTARATLMAVSLASSALGRSLSDLLSPLLYNAGKAAGSFSGMLVVAAAAALLNLVALAALSFLRSIDNRTS